MRVYVFKRNKKTDRKTWIETVNDENEARERCNSYQKMSGNYWYEFTKDAEYLKN